MPNTVYDSLTAVVLSDPLFGGRKLVETDQDFLHRLCDFISSIPDHQWSRLSEPAQDWYNTSVGEDDKLKPELTLPEGFPAPAEAVPSRRRPVKAEPTPTPAVEAQPEAPEPVAAKHTNGAAEPAKEKPAGTDGKVLSSIQLYNQRLAAGEVPPRRKRTANPDKPAKAPREPGAKRRRHRQPQANSTTSMIRVALTQNPAMTIDDLQAMIKSEGKEIAVTTIASTRAAHLASLQTIQNMGWQPPAAAE